MARLALGAFLVRAGVGHLTTEREEFQAQVPDWVPGSKDAVVLASGVVEIAQGAALIALSKHQRLVGDVVAAFFVVGRVAGERHKRGSDMMERMTIPAEDRWSDLCTQISATLREVPDGDSLTVGEPNPSRDVAGRYAQATRFGDDLVLEVVSGAYRPVSPEEHAAVLALGWQDPAEHPQQGDNYATQARVGEEDTVADLLVRSLQALGGQPDAAWTVAHVS